jgi:filamentous hemagglutinin
MKNNNLDFRINNVLFNNAGGGIHNPDTKTFESQMGTGIISNNNLSISGNLYNNNTQQYNRLEQLINYNGRIESNNNLNLRANETINYGSDNINIYANPYTATEYHYQYYGQPNHSGDVRTISEKYYTSTLTSNQSIIQSNNGTIDIDSNDNIINYNSIIYGKEQLNLETDELYNLIAEFNVKKLLYRGWIEKRKHTLRRTTYRLHSWNEYHSQLLTSTNAQASILSNGTIDIVANTINNGNSNKSKTEGNKPYSPDSSNSNNQNNNYQLSIINYQLPPNNYGLYKRVDNPNSNYLYETDPLLIDQTKFLGSQYFMNRIGLDPFSIDQKFLGDAFMEVEMIKRSLEQISYFQHTVISDEQIDEWINSRYDTLTPEKLKEIEEKSNQPLVFGKELTAEQINSLTEDIIWYITKTITLPNGEPMEVLVPQIYLCQATVNKMMEYHINTPNTSEISADNIVISSRDNELHSTLNNSGLIRGNKTVVITTDQINNISIT